MGFDPLQEFEVLEEFDPAKDFEVINSEGPEDFDQFKKKVASLLETYSEKQRKDSNLKMTKELSDLIKKEIEKLHPVQNVIERKLEKQIIEKVIQQIPVHIPPPPTPEPVKIIEKTIVEVKNIPNPLEKELIAYKKRIDELEKRIKDDLKDLREAVNQPMSFGSGGTALPNYVAEQGTFLKAINGKLAWAAASSNGGASADPFYIGDPDTDGSWRFRISGTDLLHERRESGSWVEKGRDTAI